MALDLERALLTIREHSLEVASLEEYWPELWISIVQPFEKDAPRRVVDALRELRKCARPSKIPRLSGPPRGHAYGLRQLFAEPALGVDWVERMTMALARVISSGRRVTLLVRSLVGRNVEVREAADCRLFEHTRWVVRLHISGSEPTAMRCVHHPRNLRDGLDWTTRFDWRLPARADSARYPFCPPAGWWRKSVAAVVTHASRPAWADACGRYWARPNIPGGAGHHWDVFITDPALQQRIGLSQLNIIEFGAPAKEGAPGAIHHTPTGKAGRVKSDPGWGC